MKRTHKQLLALSTGALLTSTALADVPSHLSIVANEQQTVGDTGTFGAFTYNGATDTFWSVVYGRSAGVRKINSDGSAEQYVYESDVARLARSEDVEAGLTNADWAASTLQSAILLNPQTITIDHGGNIGQVTYQPGELAYIWDGGSRVSDPTGQTGTGDDNELRFDATKRLYTYDLRAIGAATNQSPDRDNALTGATFPNGQVDTSDIMGSHGVVDWNDAFKVLVTEADIRNQAGRSLDERSGSNTGRQFAWSTDGQSIYMVDSSSYTGGLYKINAATGDTQRIYEELGTNIIAEPTVVSSQTLSFGQGTGDQIVFDGTAANGNAGGLSFFVDNGNPNNVPQALITGDWLDAFNGDAGSASIASTASDTEGNIYFYDKSNDTLLMRDTQGRVISVINAIQFANLNNTYGGGTTYKTTGDMYRLQVDESDPSNKRVLFRAFNKYIGALTVQKPGDFTADNQITQEDTAFFIEQFKTNTRPTPGQTNYLAYASADVNGSGSINSDGTLANTPVDHHDLTALRQFINLKAGDTNWDFKVDLNDYTTLKNNFNPVATDQDFFDGNFDYEANGNVGLSDYVALKQAFNPIETYESDPLLNAPNMDVAADLSTAVSLVLEIDEAGQGVLIGDGLTFDGIQIVGTNETILEGNFEGVDGFERLTGDAYLAALASVTSAGLELDGRLALGQIYQNLGLDGQDLAFSFSSQGQTFDGMVTYVPEPASLALLAMAGLGLTARRRKA